MRTRWGSLALTIALAGCGPKSRPPMANLDRPPRPVQASFGRTWDAVVDYFASRGVPVRAADRAAGVITGDAGQLPPGRDLKLLANCSDPDEGSFVGAARVVLPTSAVYTVTVRGDSTASTVKATARFTHEGTVECTSFGVWESDFETAIKAAAEGKPRAGATD